MKIIVINPRSDFSETQIHSLESVGTVSFVETHPNYGDPIFSDEEEKIIALGPEVVDWQFPNEAIDSIMNLKAICLPTTAFGWIDGAALRSKGITLTNVPHYSTESVAEYAIFMMLALARKIPLLEKSHWKLDYAAHLGMDLKGKTVGIVGLGDIGTRIAELAQAMGMHVSYWSRHARDERFVYRELLDLMCEADVIFPTLAKNSETKNILNKDLIATMKRGSMIVSNTGKEIADINAAVERVQKNELFGVAFESDEQTMSEVEGNVLITPTVAWYTSESVAEDMKVWTESIVACVKNSAINVVN